MKWLCRLGFHKFVYRDQWTPHISAKVITEYRGWEQCVRCLRLVTVVHLRWDEEKGEMSDLRG